MSKIAVVIPCYRVKKQILALLTRIDPSVWRVYVVDDCCPERSGDLVEQSNADPRVRVVRHEKNLGVGGAVMTGYRLAADEGADVIVKLDGDGQMDPALIPMFVAPILSGEADYTKGNRFYNPEDVRSMPLLRLIGNAGLSLMTKASSGYWHLFDPTNGYTALHAALVSQLPLDKISQRYFFETDMLFRLNSLRAKVSDVPMKAVYGDEESSLKVSRALPEFFYKNLVTGVKRLVYDYFLRDFSIASVELLAGPLLMTFGVLFGAFEWASHLAQNRFASSGTVMVAVLPIILGLQLFLSFLNFDIMRVPAQVIHKQIQQREQLTTALRSSPPRELAVPGGAEDPKLVSSTPTSPSQGSS